jgi:hypothetical protein
MVASIKKAVPNFHAIANNLPIEQRTEKAIQECGQSRKNNGKPVIFEYFFAADFALNVFKAHLHQLNIKLHQFNKLLYALIHIFLCEAE